MATVSSIEWTEKTWNPVTGCTKVSPGCQFCYAERLAKRLQGMGAKNYRNGFKLTEHESALNIPLAWKKSSVIFVNSMSDLFHPDVSLEFIQKVFTVMNKANWHEFQVLTKRPERVLDLDAVLPWARNIWMGTSVENKDYKHRIDTLRKTGAYLKFLSLEPLLGPLDKLDLRKVDWVIAGGESGFRPRPMKEEWVVSIRDQCQAQDIPFFFKQWGGRNKKKAGRNLQGRTWNEMPKEVEVGI